MSWPRTLIRRARAIDAVKIDVIVAVALTIASVAIAATGRHAGPFTVLTAGLATITVAWRRVYPVPATAVVCVMTAAFAIGADSTNLELQPFAVLLDFYMLGRLSSDRHAFLGDAVLLALAATAVAVSPGQQRLSDVAAGWALFAAAPYAAGRAIGSRAALTRELREKAARIEHDQHERARRAAADERNRIARELHDVIAHSVSVMVIQTQAARRIAQTDRETARDALRAVESCGRDALTEMRRMMGVMRRDDDLGGAATPALSELSTLVDRACAAGLPAELTVEGEPRALTPGLELVAFRIVQEALTNAIKHAGPAQAVVRVRFAAESLELEISDTGCGPSSDPTGADGSGHGLVGMRERLHLYGGELRTGRRRGGGFHVQARIPLREAVTT